MPKGGINPEQAYRKQKKRQAYEKAEHDRVKRRKEMSKILDEDKIRNRLHELEKEEAAGRMTIGMRQEKSKLSMQLRSISKKTPQTDYAFRKKTPINESRMAQMKKPARDDDMNQQSSLPEAQNQIDNQSVADVQNNSENTTYTESQSKTLLPKPPTTHVPIYNPMARRAAPVNAGTVELPSSMIPSSVKKHSKEPTIINNPFASIAPATQQEDHADISVPGPQLRFTLVPYGTNSTSEEESSDEEAAAKTNQSEADFASFMNKINSLPS